jgi:hypothetical protein
MSDLIKFCTVEFINRLRYLTKWNIPRYFRNIKLVMLIYIFIVDCKHELPFSDHHEYRSYWHFCLKRTLYWTTGNTTITRSNLAQGLYVLICCSFMCNYIWCDLPSKVHTAWQPAVLWITSAALAETSKEDHVGRMKHYLKLKLNSVALVRKRTIPIERPPHVGDVSTKFCG